MEERMQIAVHILVNAVAQYAGTGHLAKLYALFCNFLFGSCAFALKLFHHGSFGIGLCRLTDCFFI